MNPYAIQDNHASLVRHTSSDADTVEWIDSMIDSTALTHCLCSLSHASHSLPIEMHIHDTRTAVDMLTMHPTKLIGYPYDLTLVDVMRYRAHRITAYFKRVETEPNFLNSLDFICKVFNHPPCA